MVFVPAILSMAALAACSQEGPPPEQPLPSAALEVVAEDPGVPREQLARAIDTLFTAEGLGETRALLVLHGGEIVAERYGEGYGPEIRFTGWSMSKSVTGVLIGMLIADGRLRLDDPAPVERWQRPGEPRSAITLRHLLQMRSGLDHDEAVDPAYTSDEVRMLFMDGRDDMAGWAQAQSLAHEPGSTFTYSTASSVILADIATDTLAPDASPRERQEAMAGYVADRLAVPLGMDSLTGEYDASGTLVGGSHFWATARDWAKFGEFLRNGGSVSGAQIVPRGWIEFMRRPSPASPDYGGQLWLNHPSGEERKALFDGAVSEDIFAAVGHLGQFVIVSPRQRLTVVRLGQTDDADRPALVDALERIVALYPSR
ncbi:serine hydrolase [Aurantiacibacter sp. MUD11]|uniref:serine hydrolase domain-containing protein n=1 Tax=Aurantiacibacter sp. MUD11 TaxID=3003265 RepID=UPI0022AAF3C0|nr:serine hydrolase [Aurantiacibacter sp. MUD11]WAT17244.1 serine hydrolase [Aurantiacibacter sp. MUD11]